MRKKKRLWRQLEQWLMIDRRTWRCIIFSAIFHGGILLLLLLVILPGKNASAVDSVSFTYIPSKPFEESRASEKIDRREEVVDPREINTDGENSAESFQERLKEEGYTAKDKEWKKHLDMERKKIQQLREQQRQILENIAQRSRYGKLEPRTFYGLSVFAQQMIFVLDISGSMDIREAHLQLRNAYWSLGEKESFTIIAYSDTVFLWKTKLTIATSQQKSDADSWLKTLPQGGGTDLYSALKRAFAIASQNNAEAIYLVSDGKPTAGVQDIQKILAAVRSWNAGAKLSIHTIGLGLHQEEAFLKKLASENHGRYHSP